MCGASLKSNHTCPQWKYNGFVFLSQVRHTPFCHSLILSSAESDFFGKLVCLCLNLSKQPLEAENSVLNLYAILCTSFLFVNDRPTYTFSYVVRLMKPIIQMFGVPHGFTVLHPHSLDIKLQWLNHDSLLSCLLYTSRCV